MTTYNESFDKADSSTLGPDLTWTKFSTSELWSGGPGYNDGEVSSNSYGISGGERTGLYEYSDSFDRANNVSSMGDTDGAFGDLSGTETWFGQGGTWGVNLNQAYQPSGAAIAQSLIFVGFPTDYLIEVTLAAGTDLGVTWRNVDLNNCWHTNKAGQVIKRVSGTPTVAYTLTTGALSDGDVLKVMVLGDANYYQFWVNGIDAGSFTDAEFAGQDAFVGLQAMSSANARFDDFKYSEALYEVAAFARAEHDVGSESVYTQAEIVATAASWSLTASSPDSSHSTNVPANAVDGNIGTYWQTITSTVNPTLIVDRGLGAPPFTSVRTQWYSAGFQAIDYTITTGTDGVSFPTTVATVTGNAATDVTDTFGANTDRYVRLVVTNRNSDGGDTYAHLALLEFTPEPYYTSTYPGFFVGTSLDGTYAGPLPDDSTGAFAGPPGLWAGFDPTGYAPDGCGIYVYSYDPTTDTYFSPDFVVHPLGGSVSYIQGPLLSLGDVIRLDHDAVNHAFSVSVNGVECGNGNYSIGDIPVAWGERGGIGIYAFWDDPDVPYVANVDRLDNFETGISSFTGTPSGEATPSWASASGTAYNAMATTLSFSVAPCRWLLFDTSTEEFYAFEVNPNAGGSPALKKNILTEDTTAPDGKILVYEGSDDPRTFEFSGVLLSQDQYDTMTEWYEKKHQVVLRDDLGRYTYVYLADFQPRRAGLSHHTYRHTYTCRVVELDWQ